MKAIFLDRDDTIIKDKVDLFDPKGIEYFDDTFDALRLLQKKGYSLFVVTNQSGIARGLFTAIDVQKMHNKIEKDLMEAGLEPFTDLLFCSERDDNHPWRKPNPGMIEALIDKWNVEPSISYMIGDKDRDIEAGLRAGLESHFIFNKAYRDGCKNFQRLLDFAEYVR